MDNVSINHWPGGLFTASGGSRSAIKLSRPWQHQSAIQPETCPFCTKNEKALYEKNGWRVLENLYTPFPYHRLIIPHTCWPVEKLDVLGGSENIQKAIDTAMWIATRDGIESFLLGVHVGELGGQNLSHLHYHLLVPDFTPEPNQNVPFPAFDSLTEQMIYRLQLGVNCEVIHESGYKVTAGGHRVGQCFILPTETDICAAISNVDGIGKMLYRLIRLYQDKFTSTQGLPPDYMVGLKFTNGILRYGVYTPVLTQWGFTEAFALFGEQPIILPWTHEATAQHLRGKE